MSCLLRKLNNNLLKQNIIHSQYKCFSFKISQKNGFVINKNDLFINNHKLIESKKYSNQLKTMRTISTSTEINLFDFKELNTFQRRYKKGKKGAKQRREEVSDEESDDEDEPQEDADLVDGRALDFMDMNTTIMSMRLDNVAKAGLGIARTKVDEAFYANLFRVNGERPAKKSAEIQENDELDYIKGINQENNDCIDISRVVVKKVEDKMSSSGRSKVKLRRFKHLMIPNYETDPFDGLMFSPRGDKERE